MSGKYERNICAELQCPSACCRYPVFAKAKNTKELMRFADGNTIRWIEPGEFLTSQDFVSPDENIILAEDGLDDGSGISVIIPHDCHHLSGFSCGDMQKRLKACDVEPVGGTYCTKSREHIGLPNITKDMIDALG